MEGWRNKGIAFPQIKCRAALTLVTQQECQSLFRPPTYNQLVLERSEATLKKERRRNASSTSAILFMFRRSKICSKKS